MAGRRAFSIRDAAHVSLVVLLLAIFVTAVFALVVRGGGALLGRTGSPDLGLSILATAIVALAFEPVLSRARLWAAGVVQPGHRPPEEILAEFLARVGATYPHDDVTVQMARLLAEGTDAAYAQVWLVLDGRLRLAQTWPPNSAGDERPPEASSADSAGGGRRMLAVHHQDELLGVLVVQERDGQPMSPVEEKLFAGLAGQAGLVLRAVRLRAELALRLADISIRSSELRASRQRIVITEDDERRRLERDIHDGAQQHLIALALKLRLAQSVITRFPERSDAVFADLRAAAAGAIEALSSLSRGIYPRLLTQAGLLTALRSAAEISPVPVTITASTLDNQPSDIDAATYFFCLEALQNAAKHARASRIRIDVRQDGGFLIATVSDDGIGFEPHVANAGGGLSNMRDRVESVGGTLIIESSTDKGSAVIARIPVSHSPLADAHAAARPSGPKADLSK